MPPMSTTSLEPADRNGADRGQKRMPYFLAVPIWITLALVAWSPLVLIFRAITS